MRAQYIFAVLLCLAQLVTQAQQAKGTRPAGADVFDDLPVSEAARTSALAPGEDADRKIRANIFVRGGFDRSSCYVGEQVLLSYRLYTALESNSTVRDKPVLDGWIGKERKVIDRESKIEERNGKQYRVFSVWEVELTPLQAGALSMDPLTVDNMIGYTNAAGKMGRYSGMVSSNRAGIQVLPVPDRGKPAGFSGAVGEWVVRCRLSSTGMRTGDMDTLWVTVSGKGSFDNLPLPAIGWPEGLKALPSTDKLDLAVSRFPDSGSKTTAIPFMATRSGDYVVPPVAITFFDPGSRRYAETSSDSVSVKVSGNAKEVAAMMTPLKQENNDWSWWIGAGAVLLLAGVSGVFWRRQRMKRRQIQERLATEAHVKLETEKRWAGLLASVDGIVDEQAYLVGVKQLVTGWLCEQLKMGHLQEEELLKILRAKDAAGAAIVGAMLDRCNTLLYAPDCMGSQERRELQGRVAALIAADQSATLL